MTILFRPSMPLWTTVNLKYVIEFTFIGEIEAGNKRKLLFLISVFKPFSIQNTGYIFGYWKLCDTFLITLRCAFLREKHSISLLFLLLLVNENIP